jgi:hypothetical protein
VLGGRGAIFVVLNPSASDASGSSLANAGERLLEFDRFEIPLKARPSGRFLRFSGERLDAELGLDVVLLLISSARLAFKVWTGTCTSADSVSVATLVGDSGGDDGFDGDSVRFAVLDGASDRSSLLCLGGLSIFLGDKLGDTSCNGCEAFRVLSKGASAGRTALPNEVVSSSSS